MEQDIKALVDKADQLFFHDQLDKAEEAYVQCLELIDDERGEDYQKALGNLAFVKSLQGDYDEARKMYEKRLNMAVASGDKGIEAMMLHQLGMVERLSGHFDRALHFFEDEREIYRMHFIENNILFMAGNLYERGYLNFLSGVPRKAEPLLKKSYDYARISDDPVCIGCACRGLRELYSTQADSGKAAYYFNQSIRYFEQASDLVAVKEVEALKEKMVQG